MEKQWWFENWSFSSINTSRDYITAIKQWGDINCKVINFAGCTNLAGSIPNVEQNAFVGVTSLDGLFYNCTKLTGKIPENLFKNCSNVTNFKSVFNGCIGLIGNIPDNLFESCRK